MHGVLLLAAFADAADGSCFGLLAKPLSVPPFSTSEVATLASFFESNLNVNGTGAVIASPGSVPALPDSCPGGYRYHWVRDGALSMLSLQHSANTTRVQPAFIRSTLVRYVAWVGAEQSSTYDAHTEPKWNIADQTPYALGWCRPQTDGPGLRAQALMAFASSSGVQSVPPYDLWSLIKNDLDWIITGSNSNETTCDLWEETTDSNFLWNRVTMRSALLAGAAFAAKMGDTARAVAYRNFVDTRFGNTLLDHVQGDLASGYLTECPASGGSDSCRYYNKLVDGAVILALVHGGVAGSLLFGMDAVVAPTAVLVANTVLQYNKVFCAAYPINSADTAANVPGILYGRYAADSYGAKGGNPWVLITASLANLLYRAAAFVVQNKLSAGSLAAWRAALGAEFGGGCSAFVAAADGVMLRLRRHVTADGLHLFEQIDKASGAQYNARDLTWSYAEVLDALHQRVVAMGGGCS
jgi:glucoamylase